MSEPKKNAKRYVKFADENSFMQYYAKLEEASQKSQEYEQFLTAVKNAEDRMKEFHEIGQMGSVKMLSEDDKKELMNLNLQIGNAGENVLKSEENEELRTLVRKVSSLASGNYNALQEYDPAEPETLPEILEDVRTMKLDTRNSMLKAKVGAGQNARQPVTFVNDKGQTVTGVFTPKKELNYFEDFKKDLEKDLVTVYPNMKDIVKNFPDKFLERMEKVYNIKRTGNNAEDFSNFFDLCRNEQNQYDPDEVADVLDKIYDEDIENKDFLPSKCLSQVNLWNIIRVVQDYYHKIGINHSNAGIPEKARVDNRNAAMSTVADLLNVPNIIARARPMKIILPNGKEVEGTFMMEAKGADLDNLPDVGSGIEKVGDVSLEGTNGKAFKDIADLQVLDFICGNVDRHGANVFYQFDAAGKLIGVQGIDNDTSFGEFVPKNNENQVRLVGTQNMRVISRSMYERLEKLTPEELRFSLRGYGLTEKELDAAGKRLEILKNQIKKDKDYFKSIDEKNVGGEGLPRLEAGHVRIVDDADFKGYTINELMAEDNGYFLPERNLFAEVKRNIEDIPDLVEQRQKAYQSLKADKAIGADNRAFRANLDEQIRKTDDMLRIMKERTIEGWWKWHHGTSQKFEDMREAVQTYNEYLKTITSRIDNANRPEKQDDPYHFQNGIVTPDDLWTLSSLGERMKNTSNIYLAGKEGKRNNPYTESRMEVAEMVKAFGNDTSARKPEEMEVARRNEIRAEQRVRNMISDQYDQEVNAESGKALKKDELNLIIKEEKNVNDNLLNESGDGNHLLNRSEDMIKSI